MILILRLNYSPQSTLCTVNADNVKHQMRQPGFFRIVTSHLMVTKRKDTKYFYLDLRADRNPRLMYGTSIKKTTEKVRKTQNSCGTGCQYFVLKTCPGEDSGCALFWRFSQGLR
jgi:hypothetical protein